MVKVFLSGIHKEENLGARKEQNWFLHMDPLRVSMIITLRVQCLEQNMV